MFYSQHKDDESFLTARRQRQRRRALVWLAAIVGSYAIDFLAIALFTWAKVATPDVLLTHGVLVLIVNGIFFGLFWSGFSLRFADPNLTRVQIAAAALIQLVCMWLAPSLAFMFLSVLFIIFTFGTLRLSRRDAFIAAGLVILASVFVLQHIRSNLGIPHANSFEIFLVGFTYCTTLLRCTGIGLVGGAMRVKLHRQNKQLNEFAEKIEYMANYDDLTGILNRRAICLLVDKEMHDQSPAPEKMFVSLLDLDHFKRINDQFGHGTGDDVLKLVTEILQSMLRKNDRVGRYGGEEFLLMFAAESAEEAKVILERVRAAVADYAWDRILPNFQVTVSAGVAAHRPGEPMRQLIHRADVALYEAKRRGRNCVVIGEDVPRAA